MSPSLMQLASFGSTIEAETARAALEHAGIRVFLDGAAAADALNHVGTALGGVRLLVSSDDAAQAAEVMESLAEDAELNKAPWYCGVCREEVEANFELCWSCGRDRAEVEIPSPPKKDAPIELPGRPPLAIAPPLHWKAESSEDERNPYRSPSLGVDTAELDADDDETDPAQVAALEATLDRAWRASVIGLIAVPVLLNLYSMTLLVKASASGIRLSSLGERRFYQALVVNILAGVAWGVFLWIWL